MGLSVGRAFRETCLWGAVVIAGVLSFHHFEDAYEAVGDRWPVLAATNASRPPAAAQPAGDGARIETATPKPRLVIDASSWTPVITEVPAAPRSVLLKANSYGHFHVDARINGREVELMTDTGATYVALSYETAIRLGFTPASLKFFGRSNTANGVARVAPVTLASVRVGDIEVKNVAAVVAEPGKMSQNLLGMSFIAKLSKFELRGDRLVLVE